MTALRLAACALLLAVAMAPAVALAPAAAQAPPATPPTDRPAPAAPNTPPGRPPDAPAGPTGPGAPVAPTAPAPPPIPNPLAPPTAGEQGAPPPGALGPENVQLSYDEAEIEGSRVSARNAVAVLGEYTLRGGVLEGDFDREIELTGNPSLTYRDQTITGDRIRFTPRTRAYTVENLHTSLGPDFLQGRLLSPLYIYGGSISGRRRGPVTGQDLDLTTCDRPRPDYLIAGRSVTLDPGKRIIVRKASFYLWGAKIVTLPTLVIPLDRDPRRPHFSNLPRVGRSVDEGWFAKSALNYLIADRVPGIFRLDLMERKGVGLGVDQAWNLAKAAGLFALYTIPTGGTNRNLSGRLSNRQNLGGGQVVTLDNDFQRNSYLALPQTTSFNTRFGYSRLFRALNTTLNLARQATDSGDSHNRSYTANFAQAIRLGATGNISLGADYTRYSSVFSNFGSLTQQLATRFQADQRGANYLLQLSANKNVPVGSTGQSFFSGVERLPELSLSNFRFTRGALSRLPVTFLVSAGQYSEGLGGTSGGRTFTNRAVGGIDVGTTRYRLTGSTDLNLAGGFQQYFYGDGSAQYIVRNNTTLTQRWGRHSGVNLAYVYQRPEGGTPFRFDQQGRSHSLSADAGFLDDRRLQFTARVGYDFSRTSFGGFPAQPWQTVSANLLARPFGWSRFQTLASFDPNTGKFLSVTNDLRIRGHNDLALDVVSRYDPQVHKIGAINGYLNLPIGRLWRVESLIQYNGYLNRFESTNLQVTRDLHCMEASFTYIDNPFGFRNDRQIFFSLRIKAFPLFQRFGVGQFGQAIDSGVGQLY